MSVRLAQGAVIRAESRRRSDNRFMRMTVPWYEGAEHPELSGSIELSGVRELDGNRMELSLSIRNRSALESLRLNLGKGRGGQPDMYIVDRHGLRYYATSSNLPGQRMELRPGERRDFKVVFPSPVTTTRELGLRGRWEAGWNWKNEGVYLQLDMVWK